MREGNNMIGNFGSLLMVFAMCLLGLAFLLAISFIFMHFIDHDSYINNKKIFTKKRNIILIYLMLGYIIFYALGLYLVN